jgi:hypothetical protein
VTSRLVAWVKDDPFGVEHAELELSEDRLRAHVVAVGTDPEPYRLDYELETHPGFATARLRATTRGEGWRRDLDLRHDGSGAWTIAATAEGELDLPLPGGDPAALSGALDCDVGLSPVTNTMPILRHGLLDGGGPVELTTAWVAVPSLALHADGQRYRHVRAAAGRRVVRFEALDGSFAADVVLDPDGIVLDYPGIARRLARFS